MEYNISFVLSKKSYDSIDLNNYIEDLSTFNYTKVVDFEITPKEFWIRTQI